MIPEQAAKAQQNEPEFTLPLKVGELEFEISIQPNAESAVATAMAFCQQHGGKFGVTEETFTDSCLNPVGDYLKSAAEVEANTRNERRRKLADMEDRARQLALEPDDIVVPMKIGDALLFDKYLLHSVDLTERGITDIGRWSVLIGARAHKISYFQEKKILFKEKIKNFIKF